MSSSRIKNKRVFDLPGQIGEQQLIEIVDEGVKVAASSGCRGLWLPGID
jgi:hypothetical protein